MARKCGDCDWFGYCVAHYPKLKIVASSTDESLKCKEWKESKVKKAFEAATDDFTAAFNALENLGQESSRNMKLAILKSVADNHVIKEIFNIAYNGFVTYGISMNEVEGDTTVKASDAADRFGKFQSLLKDLAARDLSGKAAYEIMESFFKSCGAQEAIWYVRALNRDLKIGTQYGTYTKVWPDLETDFCVPKAYKVQDFGFENVKFPIAIEPKFDGVNISDIDKNNVFSAVTRTETDYPVLNFIDKQFKGILHNEVAIGELLADWEPKRDLARGYNSQWGKTMSLLKTGMSPKDGFHPEWITEEQWDIIHKELCFWVHNVCTLDIYDKKCNWTDSTSHDERRKKCVRIVNEVKKKYPNTTIRLMPQKIVRNWKEAEAVHQEHLDQNYEGSMFKPLDAPSVGDRTSNELKWKEEDPIDGVILKVLPGTGRNANWTGSYEVRLANGAVTHCNARSDKDRQDHWNRRDELVGCVIEMVQDKRGSGVGVTDFARLKRIREDLPKAFVK